MPTDSAACPFGHDYNPFADPNVLDPYPYFARLRREAPVTFNSVLGMWLVSRADDIRQVLNDAARFSSADVLPHGTDLTPEAQALLGGQSLGGANPVNTDPPRHTRLRRLLQRAFTPARVAEIEPTIRQFASETVDRFAMDGRADLVPQFAYPLPVTIILHMSGVPREDMDQFNRWIGDWLSLLFGQVPPEQQVSKVQSLVAMRRYCAALIEDRRKNPRDDLTTHLIEPEPNGEALTMDELVSQVGGSLVTAGHNNSTAMIALCLKQLLEEPARWALVRDKRELLPQVLEECMRCETAVRGITRTVTQETALGGVTLPRGARLYLMYSSADHDESMTKDPERFDPFRERPQHFTFGHGIHYCMGSQLARAMLRVAVEVLLDRLPDLRLVRGQDFGYVQALVHLRAIQHLHVEW